MNNFKIQTSENKDIYLTAERCNECPKSYIYYHTISIEKMQILTEQMTLKAMI